MIALAELLGKASGPSFPEIAEPGKRITRRHLIKTFERIGIFADQQYQGGGLRVGFGSALFPFLESSFVDPQLAGEDGTRATQLGPGAKALLLP